MPGLLEDRKLAGVAFGAPEVLSYSPTCLLASFGSSYLGQYPSVKSMSHSPSASTIRIYSFPGLISVATSSM